MADSLGSTLLQTSSIAGGVLAAGGLGSAGGTGSLTSAAVHTMWRLRMLRGRHRNGTGAHSDFFFCKLKRGHGHDGPAASALQLPEGTQRSSRPETNEAGTSSTGPQPAVH
jgi:hypothetical protein